jgi:hypothetical protein
MIVSLKFTFDNDIKNQSTFITQSNFLIHLEFVCASVKTTLISDQDENAAD